MTTRQGWFTSFLSAVAAGIAMAADLPPVYHSASRQVRVADLDARDAQLLAIWVDERIAALGRWMQQPVPFQDHGRIEIRARLRPEVPAGSVRMAQGQVEGSFLQRVVMENPGLVQEEELADAITVLLVNRYACALQTPEERQASPAWAPPWLAYGIAQHLHRGLAERNLRFVRERQAAGRLDPLAGLIGRSPFPPGRGREKAQAGVFVRWLARARTPPHLLFAPVFAAAARGEVADAGRVARDVAGVAAVADMQRAWQDWVQEPDVPAGELIAPGRDAVPRLEQALRLRPADVGLAAAELPVGLVLSNLVSERVEPWTALAARAVGGRLASLLPSTDTAFTAMVEAQVALTGLLQHGKPGETRMPAELKRLRRSLAEAEKLRAEWLRVVELRARYLDSVEQWAGLGGTNRPGSVTGERMAVGKYLDAL